MTFVNPEAFNELYYNEAVAVRIQMNFYHTVLLALDDIRANANKVCSGKPCYNIYDYKTINQNAFGDLNAEYTSKYSKALEAYNHFTYFLNMYDSINNEFNQYYEANKQDFFNDDIELYQEEVYNILNQFYFCDFDTCSKMILEKVF